MKNYIDYHNVSHKIFHNKLTFVVRQLLSNLAAIVVVVWVISGAVAGDGGAGGAGGWGDRFRYFAKWRT